jgi:hypothetical protein
MARQCAITTFDNPFDPFEDFVHWFLFDIEKGYNTCSYLDRIAKTEDCLTEKDTEEEIERAIDEIIQYDFRNIYKKVVKDEPNNTERLAESP